MDKGRNLIISPMCLKRNKLIHRELRIELRQSKLPYVFPYVNTATIILISKYYLIVIKYFK